MNLAPTGTGQIRRAVTGAQVELVLPLKANNDERGSDIERTQTGLVPSLRRYCHSDFVRKLSIVVPDRDLATARSLTRSFDVPTEVIAEGELVPRVPRDIPRRGWYLQQLIKLAYAQICETPFYVTLDADVFLLHGFGPELLQDGRAPAHYEPASAHRGWWVRSAEIVEEIRDAFHYNRGTAFGVTPAFLATDIVLGLIDRLSYLAEARRCADWIDFLCQRTTNDDDTWTEYSLYWTYLINNVRDVGELYYERPIYRFSHSPQGILDAGPDPTHRSELFGVLQSSFVDVTDFSSAMRKLLPSGDRPGDFPVEPGKFFFSTRSNDLLLEKDVLVLHDAVVDSRSWLVFEGDRVILPYVTHQVPTITGRPYENVNRLVPGERIAIDGLSDLPVEEIDRAFLVGGNKNYYHFVVDYLANLYHLDRCEIDPALLPLLIERAPGFQADLVAAFGYADQVHPWDGSPTLFYVRELHLPRKCFGDWGQNLRPGVYGWARARTAHLAPEPNRPRSRRIHISRRNALARRIANEAEIRPMLAERGFITICAEELSVSEQIRLFRNAEAVVAPHGAGATNLIYAEPGTQFVEIMPALGWRPLMMELLARGNQLDYSQFIASGSFEGEGMTVDPAALARHLDERGL